MNTYKLMLQDQIPKFGSGLRLVTVVSVGRNWVVLSYAGKKARIPLQKWARIISAHHAARKYNSGVTFRKEQPSARNNNK